MVIDQINRVDLSKVLGEVIFLLGSVIETQSNIYSGSRNGIYCRYKIVGMIDCSDYAGAVGA